MQSTNDTNNNALNKATNVTLQKCHVSRDERCRVLSNNKSVGGTIWLTGLPCSGKTTIAFSLEAFLLKNNYPTYTLDGDNIRCGLNSNLGFNAKDREENIRRISEVAKLFADSGLICIASFISPYDADRERAREIHKKDNLPFLLVHLKTPIEVCENRDVKGLYKKARQGLIKDFTGVDSEYQVPKNADIVIDTSVQSIDECLEIIFSHLKAQNIVKSDVQASVARELIVTDENELNQLKNESESLFSLNVNTVEMQWIQVLSEGWAHPLEGFMNEDEYLECLHFRSITKNGEKYNQSIPIVLSCKSAERDELVKSNASSINLVYNRKVVAVLKNISLYEHRKEERCARQFGFTNERHPYIKYINEECGDWLIGGALRVFERVKWNDGLDAYRFTPAELLEKYKQMNADVIFAFQLRNPIHNGHALLMRDTRKLLLDKGYKNPVLLLHPLGGWTKDDDAPLDVRIEQHKAVLEDGNDLDPNSTLMAIFPSPMMYAGPTEVQWHAKARMNAGCEYYIVGRDPAGMPHPDTKKDLYDPTHGARVLQMAHGLDTLKILPFKVAAYNRAIQKMDYFNPTQASNYEFISGTKMRQLARDGQLPPNGFMVEKAWNILAHYYKSLTKNST